MDLRGLLNAIEQRIRDDYLGAIKEMYDMLTEARDAGRAAEIAMGVLEDHYGEDFEAEADRVHGRSC